MHAKLASKMHGYGNHLSATSYDIITVNEIALHSWDWLKCMVTDKYGSKMHLGWNEYSLEVFDAV